MDPFLQYMRRLYIRQGCISFPPNGREQEPPGILQPPDSPPGAPRLDALIHYFPDSSVRDYAEKGDFVRLRPQNPEEVELTYEARASILEEHPKSIISYWIKEHGRGDALNEVNQLYRKLYFQDPYLTAARMLVRLDSSFLYDRHSALNPSSNLCCWISMACPGYPGKQGPLQPIQLSRFLLSHLVRRDPIVGLKVIRVSSDRWTTLQEKGYKTPLRKDDSRAVKPITFINPQQATPSISGTRQVAIALSECLEEFRVNIDEADVP